MSQRAGRTASPRRSVAVAITYSSSPVRGTSADGVPAATNNAAKKGGRKSASNTALLGAAAASSSAAPSARSTVAAPLVSSQTAGTAAVDKNPTPCRIRIHGARGVSFDTCPGDRFYAAATFGRGALLMSQRRVREVEVVDSSDDENDNDNADPAVPPKMIKRRVVEKPMLMLPDLDGGVVVDEGETYHVVTLAVNPRVPTSSYVAGRAAAAAAATGKATAAANNGKRHNRLHQTTGGDVGALGISALKQEYEGELNSIAGLKREPADE